MTNTIKGIQVNNEILKDQPSNLDINGNACLLDVTLKGFDNVIVEYKGEALKLNSTDLEIYNIIILFPEFATKHKIEPRTAWGTFRFHFERYLPDNLPAKEDRQELIKLYGKDYWNGIISAVKNKEAKDIADKIKKREAAKYFSKRK